MFFSTQNPQPKTFLAEGSSEHKGRIKWLIFAFRRLPKVKEHEESKEKHVEKTQFQFQIQQNQTPNVPYNCNPRNDWHQTLNPGVPYSTKSCQCRLVLVFSKHPAHGCDKGTTIRFELPMNLLRWKHLRVRRLWGTDNGGVSSKWAMTQLGVCDSQSWILKPFWRWKMDLNYTHQRKLNQKRNMCNIQEGSVYSTYSSAQTVYCDVLVAETFCFNSIIWKTNVPWQGFKTKGAKLQNNDSVIQIDLAPYHVDGSEIPNNQPPVGSI